MHNPAESIKLSAHELPMTDDPFWLLCLHFGLLQRLAHGWFAKQACKLRGKHLCCLLWETPDDEAQMHIHLCSLAIRFIGSTCNCSPCLSRLNTNSICHRAR